MISIPDNVPVNEVIKRVWSNGKHSVNFPKDYPFFRLAFSRPINYKNLYNDEPISLDFNYVEFWADVINYHGANIKIVNIFGRYKNVIEWVDTFVVSTKNTR